MPSIQNSEGGPSLSADAQIFAVFSWLAIVTFIQLSLYPNLKTTFGKYAFPVSFSAALLGFTILSWYCGLEHLPIHLALGPFLVLLGYNIYRKKYSLEDLKGEWHWEALFLICFFLMLDTRFVNPTISYAEKFMDHGFLASIIHTPVVPPLDPWFAGGTLNVYYYLGYWMFGCLAIVSGVPSSIAFNLALPTVFGIAAVNVYAIGTLLLNRFRWLPLLIFFLPNPSFFYQIVQGKAMGSVLWDSTRTITNTINEYPLFSFIWGDVHAHVVSIFNQVFLIFLLLYAFRYWESLGTKSRALLAGLAALSLGSMPLINTWDVLLYAPVTLLFIALIAWRNRKDLFKSPAHWYLGIIPPLAVLAYLPFYLQLQTHTGSIAIVHTPSAPAEFLLVNGFFIALVIAFLYRDIIRRPYFLLVALPFIATGYIAAGIAIIPLIYLIAKRPWVLPEILSMLGLAILVFCEIFYLKDNMGDTYFRMNTVFKCYLPAWILLGTGALAMTGRWLDTSKKIPVSTPKTTAIATVTVICLLFIVPHVLSFNSNYGTGTLDGLAYLSESHPGDAGAVAYLRTLPGDERLVEAEGGDYTYYSRVSSFTGIPAIIGMPFHEYMWRSDDTGWFSSRLSDIKTIYEKPDRSIATMKKYNVTLLYVGDSEREKYSVNLPTTGLVKIYSEKGTDIYRIAA